MGTPCHTSVNADLRREQLGLCCYCEMELGDNDGHIEHMEPRSVDRTRTYDSTNLAISCNGGTTEHCGHYKDNRNRNPKYTWDKACFAPPHDPETVKLIQYLLDGSAVPTKVHPERGAYLIGYLGLNCARLTYRRQAHARMLINNLGAHRENEVMKWLQHEHLHEDGNQRLKNFYTLSKKILET